ncbi:MAG: hypothetical protein JWM57_4141 [Phycisphaerales bacterium]|nr:hypothetical protein [Phycisphaerales bacterium]
MRKPTQIETLESRRLMATGITVGPNNLYFNAVKGQTQTYTLRFVNTGDTRFTIDRLQIVGDDSARFKVLDFPSGGRSLGVGVQVNYTVQFTAPSSTAIQAATLRVWTDSLPTKNGFSNVVPMRGMATNGTSGSSEPSLEKIFNLYNLPIKSGETDPENYHFPTTQPTNTDEINAQTFVKAGDGPVTVTPLAVFTNQTSPAIRMGYYTPGDSESGKYLWYGSGETNQSVNPFYYGTTKFDPGTAEFGLLTQYPAFANKDGSVRNVYSEKALNAEWSDSSTYNHFRVYPFINQANQVVPNSYIVAEEEFETTSLADNNDAIFIVTNVKIAGATPTLSLENLSGWPTDKQLVFNKVQQPNADVGNIVRTSNTVRIHNSGQAPLVVSLGLSSADYTFASGGGSNVTIAAGASRDVKINFNATSGPGVHNGALTITSNDPANPTITVKLVGQWQLYSEQNPDPMANHTSVEPTAQSIVNNIFGYKVNIPNNSVLASTMSKEQNLGDEVDADYFVAADGGTDARVRIVELATFHSQTYVSSVDGTTKATNSFMGWYKQGSSNSPVNTKVISDKAGTGQMVLPTSEAGASITANTFKAGTSTFGFVIEHSATNPGEYSDDSLNTSTIGGRFLRFFPAKDANGIPIPNTYIVLHDYNRPGITNSDFNDNVYLISNIIPVGKVKSPPTATAVRNAGVVLNWTSPADGPKITGFNVYRSTAVDGVYTLLTGTPLVARPSMAIHDDAATSSSPYFYAIESVGLSSKSDRLIVQV